MTFKRVIICAIEVLDFLPCKEESNATVDTLLLNPRYRTHNNIPWGILNVASYLETEGIDLQLIDATTYGEDVALDLIKPHLKKLRLVGIGAMSVDIPFIVRATGFIKDINPDCKVLLGGPHAVLTPEQSCRYKDIDYVAYGEGELTYKHLLETLHSDTRQLQDIPGLVYKENGEIKRTEPAPPAPFIDTHYTLLDPSIQKTFGEYMQVYAGRGCSFRCSFCFSSITHNRWRGRTVTEIFDEVEKLIHLYGTKRFYFRDENFFSDKERIYEFVRQYRERGFSFEWRTMARANYFNDNYVNDQLLADLTSINCEALKFGMESGSDRVLKFIKKGIKVAHIKRVVEKVAAIPTMKIQANFIIGFPTETYEDYKKTLNLAAWVVRTDPKSYVTGPHYYRLYPGGTLYNYILENHNYTAPDSMEGWAELFSQGDYAGMHGGFAWAGVNYPWIEKKHLFLLENCSFLIDLTYDPIPWLGKFNQILLIPLRWMARFRTRIGWYTGLWDLRLALWVRDFDLWEFLDKSLVYQNLKKSRWFGKIRKTRAFSAIRGIVS